MLKMTLSSIFVVILFISTLRYSNIPIDSKIRNSPLRPPAYLKNKTIDNYVGKYWQKDPAPWS